MASSEETKVEDGADTPVEGTEPKPEPVKVDERAVKLANAQETNLAKSAALEGQIEANKKLRVYAKAGLQHAETVRSWKASKDYEAERNGVASSWNASWYKDAIGQITTRVRATNPELFEDFSALDEKPSKAPSNSNERIHTRLKVGLVYKALVALIGDKVGELPYRTVANYLVCDRIFKFSETDVIGELRAEHAEFLKKQLGLLCDGKSSSSSFLNGLKAHYAALDQEAIDKANANLTPEQRKLQETAALAAKEGAEAQEKLSKVRKGLASRLAQACAGLLSPDEIAEMVSEAARKAKIRLPLGELNPKKVTKEDLSAFLESVAMKGGKSPEERNGLKMTIIRVGSMLDAQARKRKEQKAASAKPQLAAASAH
jgi:hypothetical protein